ncbi:MAG: hypothetical protein ACJA1C_001044 [Crocinitomicaceae bacterium]|jgi:hypothetical protein
MLDKRLIEFRKKVRINGKNIVKELIHNSIAKSCAFCRTEVSLTKEHVLPKWVFENNPTKGFISTANDQNQNYGRATIPACFECNSYILGELEKYVEIEIRKFDPTKKTFLTDKALEKIILWLEIIDYKFQYLELRRKFNRKRDNDFIRYLKNIPIGVMQDLDLTPSRVFTLLRTAMSKLSVKSKTNRLNSLLIFTTANHAFHFFHKRNDFIFIELPEYKTAIFYFLSDTFNTPDEAHKKAMKIMEEVY